MRALLSLLLFFTVTAYAQDTTTTVVVDTIIEQETFTEKKSPFPLYGTLLAMDKHELGQIAAQISFYNESSKPIKGFTGLVQFVKGDELILEVMLKVEKDMPSNENASWYGAVPYNYADKKESSLLDMDVDDIEMHIIVKAIVDANGYEKVYSAD